MMIEQILIFLGLLEIILRAVPTQQNWSITDFLFNLWMRLVPNRVDSLRNEVYTSLRRSTKVSKDFIG